MATSLEAIFDIFDVGAKQDLSPAVSGKLQEFATLENFVEDTPEWPRYATLEPGRFVLDGSMLPFPDDMEAEKWGVWSAEMSGEDGELTQPIVLDFVFAEEHASYGLTFHFDEAVGEIGGDMQVQWFDAKGHELARLRVVPDSAQYYLPHFVNRYCRVLVTFNGTGAPQRYLKIAGVDFGVRKVFGAGDITSARVIEEIDPTSLELPAGQLELEAHCGDSAFSILNPEGYCIGMQEQQRIQIYVYMDGERVPMGVYYLTDYCNPEDNLCRLVAQDTIGLLEKMPYTGGIFDTVAEEICADILQGFEYRLDEGLAAVPVCGWLPATNRRSALQQLSFAIGAVVDTSRDGVVKLYPLKERAEAQIGRGRKLNGGSQIEKKEIVTSVLVTAYGYMPGTQRENLFAGQLDAGEHVIALQRPAHSVEVAGGQLTFSHPNQVTVYMPSDGSIEVTGICYLETALSAKREAAEASPFAHDAQKEVSCTLLKPALAEDACKRLLNYYGKQYLQTVRVRLDRETLAQPVIVASSHNRLLRGTIEGLEIDLVGGLLATLTISGVRVDERNDVFYTGHELYTGEAGLI